MLSQRIVTLCLAALMAFAMACQAPEREPGLPDALLSYRLDSRLEGKEAKEFVNRLHFQSVTENENFIGFYRSGEDQAVIYLTRYPGREPAEDAFRKMTDKISQGNYAFINGEILQVNGQPVYRCFGMGQTHFVFVKSTQLYWISVNTMNANAFLDAYLQYLQ